MTTNIKAIIFDLDGTLTYTLEDLAISTNYALQSCGMPLRTIDEVRQFVGNGVHRLIERAVPAETPSEMIEQCFDTFRQHYIKHCQDHTRLYDGIDHLLTTLKARGYRMAIVSNKLQSGVDELYDKYFRDTIEIAIGERHNILRKPHPDMVLKALASLGVTADESIYIGDSEVDDATARAASMPCISVLWGFRDKSTLIEYGADIFADSPKDIEDML